MLQSTLSISGVTNDEKLKDQNCHKGTGVHVTFIHGIKLQLNRQQQLFQENWEEDSRDIV